MTHRQFAAWQMWLEEELNHPTKTEQYIMQNGLEVRRVLSRNPSAHKLGHMKLTFKRDGTKVTAKSRKAIVEEKKAEILARGAMTHRYVDKDGNPASPPESG